MDFLSTRNTSIKVSGSRAIIDGIADDGGLYVPSSFPTINDVELNRMLDMDYNELSSFIISKYLTDFSDTELLEYCTKAYSKFDGDAAPLSMVESGLYILELYHGPTLAFKDIALTLLPYLLTASKVKQGQTKKTLILVATSGDTGKAAMEGFRDVPGTEVIVIFPDSGVSHMQELQMRTSEGKNIHATSINGNFDDAQNTVKKIFGDTDEIAEIANLGYDLSSANSINFGRLVPQIAYYFSSYVDLVNGEFIKLGDSINFTVPCGNFGNILAGYYAKKMGLPIAKLICASNTNKILHDFISLGEYDIHRNFHKTMSPSMDILISSNLERLLFELAGRDSKTVFERMNELKSTGKYKITDNERIALQEIFVSGWCDEEDTLDTINNCYEHNDYPLDPHTAVAYKVAKDYIANSSDTRPMVVISTASPYKFPQDVYMALTGEKIADPFDAAKLLNEYTAMDIPEAISSLRTHQILHPDITEKTKILEKIIEFIK